MQPMSPPNPALPPAILANELQRALTNEVLHYFHWPEFGWGRRLLAPLVWLPTRRFVRLAVSFDEYVGRYGFTEAAHWLLPQVTQGFQAQGVEKIPASGPLIIASNHPGTFDSLVVAANLPRNDFKTIARSMPFLRMLPATRQYLIFSSRDLHFKMTAARAAIQHLQAGGTLLIFPTGDLDPDPGCLPGAREALSNWSASLDLLLKKVPETFLQVAILSHFLAPQYLDHPLAHLRKDSRQRQIIAEMLQVIQQMGFRWRYAIKPRVTFGEALSYEKYLSAKDGSLHGQIITQAQDLLESHCRAFI